MVKWNTLLILTEKILKKLNSTPIKLFIATLVTYLYFLNGFHSVNEQSRYSLIRAIVEENTFIIDKYILNWHDLSYYNGHYYSDKPPGLSFIGVPVYFIAKFLVSSWWYPYLLISLVALFTSISVVLIYELVGFLGGTNTSRLLTAITYAFGTIAWVYSKTFFPHGFSAFLLLLTMYWAYLFVRENNIKFIFLSGIAIGYSVVVEYSNFLLIVPFLLYFLLYDVKKKLVYFIVPIVLFLLILGTYHYVCFGSPFITPYRSHGLEGNMQHISTFLNPVHIGLFGLLFSPIRGLFYLSPILLLSSFGFFSLYKKYKPETVLILSSFIIIILFYSMFIHWDGGVCYGPRYLLTVIPFFTLPLFLVIEKYKDQRIFLVILFILMGYSIFANGMGVIVSYYNTYETPPEIENPLLYNFTHLLSGGRLDSHFFSVSPFTILFPIIIILICLAPTIITRLCTEEI